VLVCCALGVTRSATAVAAWLVATGRARDAESAFERIREARPQIVRRRRASSAIVESRARALPGGFMRLTQKLIFALLLFPLAVTRAMAADPDPHAEDRKELLKVFREIEASINAQSVDRMVTQMAPEATVTWLNGEVSRGHEEIKGYYNRMVRGEKRILDKYVTAAKVGAPAKFYGNGEVAVADGTTEDEFFPVSRGPFRLVVELDRDLRERSTVSGKSSRSTCRPTCSRIR
jgi:hypothetical protein